MDAVSKQLDKIPKNDAATFQTNAISWLFFAVGAVAVVMIIVSGLRMSASAGDPGAVTKAKNTMIFSIVGLIISVLAFVIVNFVLTKIGE
ncbi:hypothetical protein IKG02_01510 [Candidatus Saccharibacteria bacterium]|nr:hypothetical protein [Candidatus Saccharibacteria bacterium]